MRSTKSPLAFVLSVLALCLTSVVVASPATASTVSAASFSGGTGTATTGGVLFAKQGATLTLTVTTSNDTKCVEVSGAFADKATSSTAKSSWTFTTTAGAGDNVQSVTAVASPNFNANNCTGNSGSLQASYTLDNTGPAVSGTLSPAANASGWNNTNTTLTWSASDAGSGVASGPTPGSSNENSNGIVTRTSSATDKVGNTGTGSKTVRVDKTSPSISGSQAQNANGTTTVTFTCSDAGANASGISSCVADGTSPASASKTVTGPATVTGTATDTAGNTSTASVSVAAADSTNPTISHAVSPAPNLAGWNNSDATVTFTCADNVAVASCVAAGSSPASASRTISSETSGTLVSGTATDTSGNTATDSVTVKLDKTKPTTSAAADRAPNSNGWYKADVLVSFTCADPGVTASGVKSCPAAVTLGQGANQSASGAATDNADNTSSAAGLTGVNVDKTAPTLTGSYSPGWHTGNVTVTWTCTDALSTVDSSPAPSVVTGEGSNLSATASCSDKAGNTTATSVSGIMIDRTAPSTSVSGAPSGWTNTNVTLSFTPTDTGSGVASTTYVVDGGAAQTGSSVTLSAEGDHTVTYYSTDAAGNVGSAQLVHVKIDKTKPTLTGAATTQPNAAGWYGGDVTIAWTCTDSLSGVVGTPADSTITGEGYFLSATRTCTDNAGNTATTAVSGIKIDRAAPTSTIYNYFTGQPYPSDWTTDSSVRLTISSGDNTSGIGASYYRIDGGEVQTGYFPELDTAGDHTITFWSTDVAGNVEDEQTVRVKFDPWAPAITHWFLTPDGYEDGQWTNQEVKVHFWCGDMGGSGLASCSPDTTLEAEGSDQQVTGTATDGAGNSSSDTAHVYIDTTKPTIAAEADRAANDLGWYGSKVTVSYECDDLLSGVASCSTPDVLDTEGEDQSATGTVTDLAGNTDSDSVTGIDIDLTDPEISGEASTAWHTDDVTVNWTCSDGLSGIIGPDHSIIGPDHTLEFTSVIKGEGVDLGDSQECTDAAGHASNASVTGVRIDRTKPATTLTATGQHQDGWYVGGVSISLEATDNLSEVAGTLYTVDGGDEQTYSEPFTLSDDGEHTVAYWSEDNAGNVEQGSSETFELDSTAPTISGTPTTSPNGKGWYDDAVTIDWTCSDATSGIIGPDHSIIGPEHSFTSTITGDGSALSDTQSCTDAAGNVGSATVDGINIDTVAPTTLAYPDQAAQSGWFLQGTTLVLESTDATSGVDVTRYAINGGDAKAYDSDGIELPDDGTFEIAYWSLDNAGNQEGSQSITLKVDQTPPTLTGEATTDPNDAGWYHGNVTIAWVCSDDTSGIAGTCPDNSLLDGEGPNNTATASVDDVAGNHTETTVSGIQIDRTPPITLGSIPAVPASGWFTSGVSVTLDASDNLSEVKETLYSVDGGVEQTYSGPFTVTGDGEHSVSFYSVDKADNEETAGAPLTFAIDTHAPMTTRTYPIVPDSGWFVDSGIPFAFDATDADSGVAATYYTIDSGDAQTYGEPFTEDLSDGGHTISYWSVDNAGNEEEHRTFDINVDTVKPTISGSQSPVANSFGWNNTNVDVAFTCSDATPGSGVQTGVAGCAGATPLVNETTADGVSVVGDAVDNAGNSSHITYGPVKIDKTEPTLAGTPSGANGAGWAKGDITVTWSGDDALSGIDPATQPAPSPVTGEGRHLSASASIKDRAGNTGTGSVSGLKIDRGAPTVTGSPTTPPNAAGWFSANVVVDWTCADPKLADDTDGSGIASCPTSNTIFGDGVNKGATSAKPVDVAGNEGVPATVSGINIDGTAPSTTADNQCTKVNGWCTGTNANVVLSATDQVGLSGVKEIHYKVDGGPEQVASGTSTTVTVPLSGSGAGTVDYWAVDRAGNAEAPNKASLKWDNIAPTVTHSLSPAPNADEWNNGNVTVSFAAADDDKGSGVASVTSPVTISAETPGQLVTGTAKDTAGNTGTDSVTVKLDKTKPTITAAVTAGALGDNGWYTGPVTVTFTCSDALSGIAATACPSAVVLTDNGANNSVTRTVLDRAGNDASATLSGIKIDQEKPTLTAADVNVANGSYTLGTAPRGVCGPNVTDRVSGLLSCGVTVTGGNANGVGTFGWSATARDRAGNTTTVTGTYQVTYRWDGVLQPINDTGHMVPGTQTSMFKAGSTIPVKFQLKNAAGQVVQPTSAPDWLAPVMGNATSAPVNETLYAASADSGSDYRYDSAGQQWIYNWQTGKAAGNYWRIGVRFDDGQTYFVNIGLR